MAADIAEFRLTPDTSPIVSAALSDINLMHRHKPYHNLDHALSVIRWSNTLAGYYDLPDDERSLIVTAAAFHDYIHDSSPEDEVLSAGYAREHMEASRKFGRTAIQAVAEMIDGTIVEKVDGRLIQRASRSERLGARIVADADLSSLGSPFEYLYASTIALLNERIPGAGPRGPEMYALLGEGAQLLGQEPLTDAGRELLPHRRENLGKILQLRAELGEELGLAA